MSLGESNKGALSKVRVKRPSRKKRVIAGSPVDGMDAYNIGAVRQWTPFPELPRAVHIQGFQPLLQSTIIGDRYHATEAVVETFVQILVAGNRGRRVVVLAAKSEEELHHVLWVAVLSLLHVDRYARSDGFFPVRSQKPVKVHNEWTHWTFSTSWPEALEPLFGFVDSWNSRWTWTFLHWGQGGIYPVGTL